MTTLSDNLNDLAARHTPGPWEFVMDGTWPMILSSALDEDGEVRVPVVDMFHGGYDFADRGWPLAANARLIAAAPDLLEACIHAACQFRYYEQLHLAKGTQDGDEKAHRNHELASRMEAAIARATQGDAA